MKKKKFKINKWINPLYYITCIIIIIIYALIKLFNFISSGIFESLNDCDKFLK